MRYLLFSAKGDSLKIQKDIYNQMVSTCPPLPPETGGILGGNNGIITHYFADIGSGGNAYDQYVPNVDYLNAKIEEWCILGISFYGIYHSHFPNGDALSTADIVYIERIMRAVGDAVKLLYFPIVLPKDKMVAYRAEIRNGQAVLYGEPVEYV